MLYTVTDQNIAFLVPEQQKETVTVQAVTSKMTLLKTVGTTLDSTTFGRCFGPFDIEG